MLKSARVPERAYAIAMWLVSLVFAAFLIGFGRLVIGDLPRLDDQISIEQFMDQQALDRLQAGREALNDRRTEQYRLMEAARLKREEARNAYASARDSFDNWIRTRRATSNAAQDPEVLRRTAALDRLKVLERATEVEVESLQQNQNAIDNLQVDLDAVDAELVATAQPRFERAMFVQELKVFGWRLLFTLPLLVVAGWLVAKKRKSDYWPLMRGFVIAALFAFFVELVPYLPSYGGYVRYIVGIALTLVTGHFIIKNMRAYLVRRQQAEAQAETERRKQVSYEEAFKKMSAKICPGCDRPVSTTGEAEANFCVHCGMTLFDTCTSCNTRKMAFFRYCMTCGTQAASPDASSASAQPG